MFVALCLETCARGPVHAYVIMRGQIRTQIYMYIYIQDVADLLFIAPLPLNYVQAFGQDNAEYK
jgi:hypothetical protein